MKQATAETFSYGAQRIPAALALQGLFALPPLFALHTAGTQAAGKMAFGLSILRLFATLARPVSAVLMPNVSRFVG